MSKMFSQPEKVANKNNFLDQVKCAREERNAEKLRDNAAICIQANVRGMQTRRKLISDIRSEFDNILTITTDFSADYKPTMKPCTVIFRMINKFLFVFNEKEDKERFECLCKYLLFSMSNDSLRLSYASVGMMNKANMLPWIQQAKTVIWRACLYLKILKPENVRDMRMIQTCLSVVLTFTSANTWKILKTKEGAVLKAGMTQLCNNIMGHLTTEGLYPILQTLLMRGLVRSKPAFNQTSLSAIITISLRPVISAEFSDKLMTLFLLNILATPAVVHYIITMSQECTNLMITERVFKRSNDLLSNTQSTKIIFNALEGNYALCLLANLIQLGNLEIEGLVNGAENFMVVATRLLACCQRYVQGKRSNLTHWHPVLGWFSQKTDESLFEAMPSVVKQLQLLWSSRVISLLFEQLFSYSEVSEHSRAQAQKSASASKNILKKAMSKASGKLSTPSQKLQSSLVQNTCHSCQLYLTTLSTLTQLRLDVLAGLCYQDILLPKLWLLITNLGSQNGLKVFLDLLSSSPNDTSHPVFQLLTLSCDAAAHIITILDDVELYDQQKPFSIENLITITNFLNYFVFRSIWNHLIDVRTAVDNPVFLSVLTLLKMLYERDCRRPFAPEGHWLINDIRSSTFLSDLEKNKKHVHFLIQLVPHIIPHKERVILFRKQVNDQKEALGLVESVCVSPQPTLITVHRPRIIEDGYRQLALLPPKALKGVIRVKFVNEQGLDEAGIDQDGVFKEFLEETVSRVFDPSLNLFKVTDEQKLYPSPTSHLSENHLALFNFVGRMLGKAVYEGIVVDVPFASFFLSVICSQQHTAVYSSIDELPSLDADLYKSLTYIKRYEGDMADLDLTFSSDEDIMGQIVTHELIPGGKIIPVTNENKIRYVHLMAHFRMRVQIREQTQAFLQGFKSIVNSDWLTMFSAPELQKLISGDTVDLDLEDLRKHTQYYGGFHNNHKVVKWLWDVLLKDFNVKEQGQFLKFVTSCSKPPLLGFSYLEPPFSIRCVEVSDEQDTGDTVGTVLKGFFNLRKHDPVGRLPTSSTCFNLLKLPNYQKRATLRDKLRYAISSNTGFELS